MRVCPFRLKGSFNNLEKSVSRGSFSKSHKNIFHLQIPSTLLWPNGAHQTAPSGRQNGTTLVYFAKGKLWNADMAQTQKPALSRKSRALLTCSDNRAASQARQSLEIFPQLARPSQVKPDLISLPTNKKKAPDHAPQMRLFRDISVTQRTRSLGVI